MKYLIVHDAAPGQFIHIYKHLRSEGHEVVVASRRGTTHRLPVKQLVYELPEELKGSRSGYTAKVIGLGLSLYEELKPLAFDGWAPDVILSHASRGASYFLRDLFPRARIVSLFEWYYGAPNPDTGMDEGAFRQQAANAAATNMPISRDFDCMDAGYTPTLFQRDAFPKSWHRNLEVIHDGIDTDFYTPANKRAIEVNGKRFRKGDEIVTYAARGMEHTRGFVEFMAAISEVQKRRPDLQVLIAAADRLCYDPGEKGKGLKSFVDETIDYDRERTHFLGLVPEAKFVSVLQVSSLHVYLTKPFVLSWSLLNAMSVGIPVLGSASAPVQEVISNGDNGLLVSMDDGQALADAMDHLLADQVEAGRLGRAGRETVIERYGLAQCLQRQLDLMRG
ncbi:MAG: glycosyltransferase [Alphaproteobacteria bacterium]|nr:glycosyltransferase [Alphaproteobacteria bacterium]